MSEGEEEDDKRVHTTSHLKHVLLPHKSSMFLCFYLGPSSSLFSVLLPRCGGGHPIAWQCDAVFWNAFASEDQNSRAHLIWSDLDSVFFPLALLSGPGLFLDRFRVRVLLLFYLVVE